ncbi:hypothetical protein CKY47_34515 [Saccharothrix yanglingensis]|uniref:Secreted protein n=1 Tax=Saccharothrix yanglingensis TaxID=659496 RepID=A0ABU0XA08_9PSEU|nr:hypothetical protein [Saccharothrix yanglingensis]
MVVAAATLHVQATEVQAPTSSRAVDVTVSPSPTRSDTAPVLSSASRMPGPPTGPLEKMTCDVPSRAGLTQARTEKSHWEAPGLIEPSLYGSQNDAAPPSAAAGVRTTGPTPDAPGVIGRSPPEVSTGGHRVRST